MVNIFMPFTRNPSAPAILTTQSRRDCVDSGGDNPTAQNYHQQQQQQQQQQTPTSPLPPPTYSGNTNNNYPLCSSHANDTVTEDYNHRMMSPKRWILLLIFYISYLMFGASIYYHIEHRLETEQRQQELRERIEIHDYLIEQLEGKNETAQTEVLERITEYCGKPVTDYTKEEYEIPFTWTFYHSFFFAFTVCSTVGYGNISPTTTLGRMIMVIYSVIGIPVNGILFAGLGEYFGRTFQAIYDRYKKYKMSNDKHYVPLQLGLVSTILIALVPGITLFLLIPAWVFSYFEGWSYPLAFYYSYVTTTTIGFGDYVPTFQPQQPREFGGWFVVYQIFVIVWFIFSLGYLLMIMTFITRGLQSKKLKRLEQQLSSNIKATHNRIWNGVTKDVGYLRRILNELYIMKLKPVYTFDEDSAHVLTRANSCPELTMYRVDPVPIPGRRRTFSVGYDTAEARAVATPTMARSSSDTELDRIDREKSFETAEAYRRTTGLLAQVVGALAAVNKPPLEEDDTTLGAGTMYGGYHGFSDSQILASEWSFPATNEMPRPRGRAASDFNLNPKTRLRRTTVAGQNEWTWSGDNDQIQEAINVRTRQMDRDRENLYRNSFGLPTLDDVAQVEEQDGAAAGRRTSRIKKFSMPDGFRKLFPFKKRSSQTEFTNAEDVEKAPNHRKFSVVSVPETMHYQNPPLDYYSTVTANASPGYFSNGQSQLQPSQGNLNQRLSNGHLAETNSLSNTSYQRNVLPMGGARKRRDSIFAQNPALANRRGSLYPPAAINQRRGSLFTTERRGSTASAMGHVPTRRGSLFPVSAVDQRRPSILSAASQENQEILENTTLADLIRALEAMHTQAVLDEAAEASNVANKKKTRKSSSNTFEPNPLLSLFGNNDDALKAAAANRLYARRSTIVGTLPQTNQSSVNNNNASNLVNRRRLSTMHMQEPPPSYSKEPTNNEQQQQQPQSAAQTKFKRRFSVRPTALQIPPGKAPPPGVNISTLTETGGSVNSPTAKSTLAPLASPSQTVLQRRLSLRPSPLATSDGTSPTSPTSTNPTSSSSSTTRLLSPTARPSTTSTHSPLSRIVQISQAQRKSSMPEGFNARKGDQ